ncbi:hypothetical protein IWQ60_007311 [Tieghemiomyces parasiticus]|uniref:Ubiquitin-like domain-containing protein n=1 Tax=Tieghemiomyces parasiticus TaxID=78921 RepID=A0A9W8A1W1_9FUNG|nr:hypothetical protein IWQ60_007311 [Tieghemiomyces parasiticus]
MSSSDEAIPRPRRVQPKPKRRPRPTATSTDSNGTSAAASAGPVASGPDDFFRRDTSNVLARIAQSLSSNQPSPVTKEGQQPRAEKSAVSAGPTQHRRSRSNNSNLSSPEQAAKQLAGRTSYNISDEDSAPESKGDRSPPALERVRTRSREVSLSPPPEELALHYPYDEPLSTTSPLFSTTLRSPSTATTYADLPDPSLDPDLAAIATNFARHSSAGPDGLLSPRRDAPEPSHHIPLVVLDSDEEQDHGHRDPSLPLASSLPPAATYTIHVTMVPCISFLACSDLDADPVYDTQYVSQAYHVTSTETLQALFETYCSTVLRMPRHSLVMAYNDTRVFDNATPAGLGLHGAVEIYCYMRHTFEENRLRQEHRRQAAQQERAEEERLQALYAKKRPASSRTEDGATVDGPSGANGGQSNDSDEGAVTNSETDDEEEESSGFVRIKLRGKDGVDVKVKVPIATTTQTLVAQYCRRKKLDPTTQRVQLEFEGEILDGSTTVEDLDLEDGDQISVVIRP